MLVNAVWYRDGQGSRHGDLAAAAADAREHGGFVWVGLHDPRPEELAEIVDVFGLHPLAAEDVMRARQRPKVERFDDWLFIVMRTARYLDDPETIEFGEIQVLCHENTIIVIRHGRPVPLAEVRRRLEADPSSLDDGPVGVVHAVMDEVVDAYLNVLAGLDDDVSEVELDVFADHEQRRSAALIERIYFLQREVLELHRALHPMTAALPVLRDDRLLTANVHWDAYFRDVTDHLQRAADQLQTIRELIAAALSATTAQVGLRQNDDMRKISAWVAMAAVPTMIAGIYGMNFDHMPELGWIGGYPLALGLMAVGCTALYRMFRRSGWL
jgi:magnesium transporter